jgi:hypothetical protein
VLKRFAAASGAETRDSSAGPKSQEGGEYFTGRRGEEEPGTVPRPNHFLRRAGQEELVAMRSVLLWLIGVPIPLILLLAFCTHHL